MTSAQGLVIGTTDLRDKSGYYISSAGDFNNDTYRDLLVSAPYAFNKVGAVYVITNALSSNTQSPTLAPNNLPKPSKRPSTIPTVKPSGLPSARPSKSPSVRPSTTPGSFLPTEYSVVDIPSCDPSSIDTSQPSDTNLNEPSNNPTRRPSRQPSSLHFQSQTPTRYLTLQPSNSPTNRMNSFSPTIIDMSSMPSSFDSDRSSILDASQTTRNNSIINTSILIFSISVLLILLIMISFSINFSYIYKLILYKSGYNTLKIVNYDHTLILRVASLDDCIQHFWEYRGVIYKKGTVTDDLFSRFDNLILNALDDICMNPNILCPVSYYKVVCHMADRKSDAIRNKAYETLLVCKSAMSKCVTMECIQLLRRMFIDCGRIDVKEHAVSMLCEISHSNPNLITFDIYDMLRSYKMKTSDMSLSHVIEITLQEISETCVHLHTQIDEYEKSMLPTCYNNNNIQSDCCEYSFFSNLISDQLEGVEHCIKSQKHFLESESVGNLSEHNRLNDITITENNLVSYGNYLVHHNFSNEVNTVAFIGIENNSLPALSSDSIIHSDVASFCCEDNYSSESNSSNENVMDDMVTNFVVKYNEKIK
jgi:hypothetical protein